MGRGGGVGVRGRGASFYFIASHLNRIRNVRCPCGVAWHGMAWHVACGMWQALSAALSTDSLCAERERERHTHFAICLCHKHIKSAIKRIGSQMRHETIREMENGKR